MAKIRTFRGGKDKGITLLLDGDQANLEVSVDSFDQNVIDVISFGIFKIVSYDPKTKKLWYRSATKKIRNQSYYENLSRMMKLKEVN